MPKFENFVRKVKGTLKSIALTEFQKDQRIMELIDIIYDSGCRGTNVFGSNATACNKDYNCRDGIELIKLLGEHVTVKQRRRQYQSCPISYLREEYLKYWQDKHFNETTNSPRS